VTMSTTIFATAPLELLMEMIFQWRASELGIVMTLLGIAGAVALTVVVPTGLYVFGKFYKVSSTEIDKVDIRLIQVGCFTVFLGAILMGFAGNGLVFVVGACTIQMSAMTSPVVQSAVVKYAEKKHIGLVFGALNQIVQLSSILAQTTSLAIFQRFIDSDPRITLHLSATAMGLFIIVLIVLLR
jgi:MFS family permease